MDVLVTGGAGYIGSVTSHHLIDEGYGVTVLDDFSTGHHWPVREMDVVETDLARVGVGELAEIVSRFDAVLHFAARSTVERDLRDWDQFHAVNVTGTANLLHAMRRADVDNLVFSSSAAVYGAPETQPITEDAPLDPVNYYGLTKMQAEDAVEFAQRVWSFDAWTLRYFNAVGADEDQRAGEWHNPETHLVPKAIRAAVTGETFRIYGSDYDTQDGTPVRDFVHVVDLARAHIEALEDLAEGESGGDEGGAGGVLNIGLGTGYSVKEVLDIVEYVTGEEIEVEVGPRRSGDPPRLIADPAMAYEELGFEAENDLEDAVNDAWLWEQHLAGIEQADRDWHWRAEA